MSTEPQPKRRGRPPISTDGTPLVQVNVRLTTVQRAKFERLGGVAWLRERIDSARERQRNTQNI